MAPVLNESLPLVVQRVVSPVNGGAVFVDMETSYDRLLAPPSPRGYDAVYLVQGKLVEGGSGCAFTTEELASREPSILT